MRDARDDYACSNTTAEFMLWCVCAPGSEHAVLDEYLLLLFIIILFISSYLSNTTNYTGSIQLHRNKHTPNVVRNVDDIDRTI